VSVRPRPGDDGFATSLRPFGRSTHIGID